ncbi:heavy metal-associated isoprenylated plant protein 23 [Tanacetum coccineum]
MGVVGILDYISDVMTTRRLKKKKMKQFNTVSLKVRMDCEGCQRKVKNALSSLKVTLCRNLPNPPKNRSRNNVEPVFLFFRSMPRDDPIIERIPRRSLKKRNITPSKNELPHIGSNVAFEENMISRFNISIARRTRDDRNIHTTRREIQ